MITELFLLPGNDGARLDELQDFLPGGPQPGEPRPQEAIGRTDSWAMDGLLIHRDLML
jgi:hypothetical protein